MQHFPTAIAYQMIAHCGLGSDTGMFAKGLMRSILRLTFRSATIWMRAASLQLLTLCVN
ncbi:hypothetical protein [Celerinatantimonas diazotrophica]|uniref:hypothetical protein n=1 Tax=Celerinatantimonas diazotrophica TaxID=412034 RepID=UPI0014055261|nr:hypothetical protein [Celerinatantimonas diazotrophica]